MRGHKAMLLGGLVLATALSGCFGSGEPVPPAQLETPPELDAIQQERLEALAAPEHRAYTLPGSASLPPQVAWFNGTVDAEANTGIQDRNMRGGNDYGVHLQTFDIASLVPPGQPTALRITLSYFGQAGSSAQSHIYVCVPGTCTYYTTNNNDEFNWKATVEVLNVATIGIAGQPALVGVASASGKVVDPMEFALKVEARYFADVLTPAQAYAFRVPEGATGVTLRSVKPGQEHLQARFVVLDPADQLVSYTEYDDIAIVSESIFVPTRVPGEYVFYAQEMHNGFFSIESDTDLGNDTALRALPVTLTETVDFPAGALNPGVPERDWVGGTAISDPVLGVVPPVIVPRGTVVTPYSEGTSAPFSVEGFPLEVGAFIGPGVTGAVEVRITSEKGLVYRLQRMARMDDDRGSLGYTRDENNLLADWSMLAPGSWTMSVVVDGQTGDIGHWVKSFVR